MVKKNAIEPVGEDEFDLASLVGVLRDHKWMIGGVTGAFLALSAAYAIIATPIYQADALIQVTNDAPMVPGITDVSQMLAGNGVAPRSVTEIALIGSRSVMQQTVDDLGLAIRVTPHYFPVFGHFIARRYDGKGSAPVARPLFGLRGYAWGGEALRITSLDVPDQYLNAELTLTASGNGGFTLEDSSGNVLAKGVAGQSVSNGGVTVNIATLRANAGMKWTVVKTPPLRVVADLQRRVDAAENAKGSGVISLTYQSEDPNLARQVLSKVCDVYLKQNVSRNSAEAASSLQFVRSQLPIIRKQLEKAESALNAFQIRSHSVNVELQTKGFLDQFVAIDTNLSQLRLKQAEVERRFTSNHPAYQALQQQIAEIQAQKDALSGQLNKLPDTQKELLRLNRDVQVTNQIYTGLLNQEQQLDIARAGNVGNARLIDPAVVDETAPVSPKRTIIVVVGTLLGLFLSVAFVFVRRVLNRGLEDPELIEQLGLPVYSSIPVSPAQSAPMPSSGGKSVRGKPSLLALDAPADLAIESLRSLRTSLHFALMEASNNILMISGSSPGAGKTFVSSNLAVVIAQAGQRVLLIDGDLRKGVLHRVMSDSNKLGLADVLMGQARTSEAIRKGPIEGLDYVTRGRVPPNPAELLAHANLRGFLDAVKGEYDLVIVDTPPILAVTDAGIVGSHAGTSLMVVRFGLNSAREIALAKSRFEQNAVQLKGAIFNAVQPRSNGYHSYGYYEYGSEKE
ncbi:polysaccharide biosynthesis tyrosine autokinase [Chitinasiproducens palmae]|uniref:Putative tyrosine-protein kinase EpsB n=1 Tax=Chitinasiproducens palmae TaxID=1770053 RepID=A0A1H2PPJ7_9BURK|nr:polysaccharide biosynthesis tyrosine autokinase [Chitinasiproducens palmae]SDV48600.1 tyrosine-protein kinase Etk/Wzc [Chitinasiproducens palmae]